MMGYKVPLLHKCRVSKTSRVSIVYSDYTYILSNEELEQDA